MGKNQTHKAMQRARLGSTSAVANEIEDGMVDGSFHSPEWHAARLAGLKTTHTVTWEEFKKKLKEDEMKKGELEADTDRMMQEYRAQLDAQRARKLAQGRNHSGSKSNHKKDRKVRELKKNISKRRKRSKRRSSDYSSLISSSESSSSDEGERESQNTQNLGIIEPRRKRSTGLEGRRLAVIVKRLMGQCHSQDSLGVQRLEELPGGNCCVPVLLYMDRKLKVIHPFFPPILFSAFLFF